MNDLSRSNSLADLAARILTEHRAVSTALKESVRHAIAAGELLIEAKNQVPHGGWLPWLQEHCTMSERTAQLYMRVAKNRTEIENQIRNDVADLSLNETAAMLMLSSDVRKLLAFARDCENLFGEELIERCIAEGVAVLQDSNYDPFANRTGAEILEWHLFVMFLSFDPDAGRAGGEPKHVWDHVEWILQRPFQNVSEWLGDEGDKFRRRVGMGAIAETFKAGWTTFLAERRNLKLADVREELNAQQKRVERAIAEGRVYRNGHRKRRNRAASAMS